MRASKPWWQEVVAGSRAKVIKVVVGLVSSGIALFFAKAGAWLSDEHFPWWWYAAIILSAILTGILRWRFIELPLKSGIVKLKKRLKSLPTVGHLADIRLVGKPDCVLVECVIGVRKGSSDVPLCFTLATTRTGQSKLCVMEKSGELVRKRPGGWLEQSYTGEIPITAASRLREAVALANGPSSNTQNVFVLLSVQMAKEEENFSFSEVAAGDNRGPDRFVRVANWNSLPPEWAAK